MLIKLKRSYPLLLVLTTILAAQTPQLVAQGQGKPMLETAPAGGVLADYAFAGSNPSHLLIAVTFRCKGACFGWPQSSITSSFAS